MPSTLSLTRRAATLGVALAASVLIAATAQAGSGPDIGKPAPGFSGTTAKGGTVSLADYQGKTVVLEWTNKGCPYVRKHYGAGNMQKLQREATAEGIVWLSVISSAPGAEGYMDGEAALAHAAAEGASPTEILLDPDGTIGHLFDARTTPHMYIVDPSGTLVYKGGIDDKPTTRKADIETANNYVRAALEALKAGKPISQAVTRPYGCSVKYAS